MANSQKGKIDMTTGHIMRNIILFAIPIIIGNVLQQLYTTVDALVIGKYCGDTSLAAVGTSSQPVEVLLCVFLGIGTGVSILISQYTGARESGKVVSVCGTSITFIYIIGIPIGILGWFAAPYILEFMKVPQDVWDAALIYTRVVFLGTLGNLGYNMNAGILRGLGDSKASLWFLVVSCVSNIVFDLLFVAGVWNGCSRGSTFYKYCHVYFMDCKYCLHKKEVSGDTVYIFAEKILWNNDERYSGYWLTCWT